MYLEHELHDSYTEKLVQSAARSLKSFYLLYETEMNSQLAHVFPKLLILKQSSAFYTILPSPRFLADT